jgi:hypothetical protein
VRAAVIGLIGLVSGAIAGAVMAVIAGIVWTSVFETPSFEGYSGMLVFYSFMPIGAILGGLTGAMALWHGAARLERDRP